MKHRLGGIIRRRAWRRRAAVVSGLLLLSSVASALPPLHGPFFPEEDYVVAMEPCSFAERHQETQQPPRATAQFGKGDGAVLVLSLDTEPVEIRGVESYRERYIAHVEQNGERATADIPLPFASDIAYLVPEEAICSDVNHDGITDFVTDHWRHGNGLGASFYDRLVVLSSSRGYRFWTFQTMSPSPEDYVTFGHVEPFVMVTTSFANSGGPTPHSYLVYDLWTFGDGEVVSANGADPRFPKWVWLTFTENHRPASSLSDADKARMRTDSVVMELSSLPGAP